MPKRRADVPWSQYQEVGPAAEMSKSEFEPLAARAVASPLVLTFSPWLATPNVHDHMTVAWCAVWLQH